VIDISIPDLPGTIPLIGSIFISEQGLVIVNSYSKFKGTLLYMGYVFIFKFVYKRL
jgi:hypothetical protein